ncbi:hypothetical protein PR048_011954, partial [Dryococelus australis]
MHTGVQNVFLMNILQIYDGRLYSCVSKPDVLAVVDSRVKKTPGNKVDDIDVINHIHSFPEYQSHYSRHKNPEIKYLNSDLSIRKMYDIYLQKCNEVNKTAAKKKFYYYYLYFISQVQSLLQINTKIYVEKDDEKTKLLKIDRELHLRQAEQAREDLKLNATSFSDECYILTFDHQKALPFPKLSTSVSCCKRNLNVYNFGIHTFNEGNGFMYKWDETERGSGSQDLSSCQVTHLKEHAKHCKHVIMSSENFAGQNRNIKVVLGLKNLVQNSHTDIEVIYHKLLVSGHSYLPNDANFGLIEANSRKTTHIYSLNDWMAIVREAKRKSPFKVIEMRHADFFSTKELEESIVNRKNSVDGCNVNWLQMRWLRYEKSCALTLKYKSTLNPDIKTNLIVTKTSRSSLHSAACSHCSPEKGHVGLLTFIPPVYQPFFKHLPIVLNTRRSQLARDAGGYEDSDEI